MSNLSKLILALTLSLIPFTANALTYNLNLIEGSSYADTINNSGQIVGNSSAYNDSILWNTDNSSTHISNFSYANAINNNGLVVGYGSPNGVQAMFWQAGSSTYLGGGVNSVGNGVNDAGQIVGATYNGNGVSTATLWSNGTITYLSSLGGVASYAHTINSLGQVVGESNIAGDANYHATLWNGTNASDLGVLNGYVDSTAYAINDTGQIVGRSIDANGASTATLWSNGTITNLGTLAGTSKANAINASGLIVGVSHDDTGSKRATLWDGTNIIDLNSFLDASTVNAGWVLKNAHDINDSGWIVGNAENSLLGISSAVFILTPVPEINTNAMLLIGLGLFSFMARGRKVR